MEEKKILNEKETDTIVNQLKEVRESSNDIKAVDAAINMTEEEQKASIAEEPKSAKVIMSTNVLTGEKINLGSPEENIPNKSAINSEDCLNEMPNIDDINFSNEAIKNQLKSEVKGISDEDVVVLSKIVQRYRNKENFKIYEELPPKVKGLIIKQLSDNDILFNKQVVEAAAEALISNIISGVAIDQYQVEFNDAMGELMNEEIPEITHYVVESIKKRVEVLRDKANELREKGEDEKADSIENIAKSCEDAYTFDSLLNALKNHSIKIKKFDIEKSDRIFKDFDIKYQDSPYKIRTVSCIPNVLNRVLPVKDYRTEHLIAFTVAFCKYCMNYKPSNPEQHSFMYYTIQSIIYLDINSEDEEFVKFKDGVLSKIKECLEIIDKDYNYLWK